MEIETESSVCLNDEEINQNSDNRKDSSSLLQGHCHRITDTGLIASSAITTTGQNLDGFSNHQKPPTAENLTNDTMTNLNSVKIVDIDSAVNCNKSVLDDDCKCQSKAEKCASKGCNNSSGDVCNSCRHGDESIDIGDGNEGMVTDAFSDCSSRSSVAESSRSNCLEANDASVAVVESRNTDLDGTVEVDLTAVDVFEKRNLSLSDKPPDELKVNSSSEQSASSTSSVEAVPKTDEAVDYKSLNSCSNDSFSSSSTFSPRSVDDEGSDDSASSKDYSAAEFSCKARTSTIISWSENPAEDELLAELENEFFSTKDICMSLGDNQQSSLECRALANKLDAVQRRLEHTLSQRKELEVENARLEQKLAAFVKNTDSLKLELESVITAQQRDNDDLRAKIDLIEEKSKQDLADVQIEHQLKIDQLTRLYDDCVREKDAAVVRYAQAEQKNIDVQDRLQKAEARVKEWTKEREIALVKWHAMKSDIKKSNELNQTLASEVSSLRKEVDKYKELSSSADVKVKWHQNKIKVEQDALKDNKAKLQEVEDKMKELKQEEFLTLDQIRTLFIVLQEVDEGKIPVEIMQKKELSDIDELLPVIRKGLRLVEMKERELVAELQTLRDKVRCLEVERLSQEESLNSIKDNLYCQKQGYMDLQDRILMLEKTENMLHESERRLRETLARVDDLESVVQDQRAEIEQFVKREAEQLEFTSRISEKNTHLLAENSKLSSELLASNCLLEETQSNCDVLREQNKNLTEELTLETNKAAEDVRGLREELEQERLKLSSAQLKLDDLEDEVKTMKRRHTSNVKDLTRQLQIANRRVADGKYLGPNGRVERDNQSLGSLGSQGGSCGSLDTAGLTVATTNEPSVQYDEGKTEDQSSKESLLAKIGSLEKAVRRKSEKIEFLRDHVDQLIEELHRKSRIIQGYVLREEAGTLVPESSDKNKAQLAKKGGVMASLYASHALDGSMTMGLSLEINRKLQALLEDTLLKNMKLKEGMDTLGQEIDWLSRENKRLQQELERTADQSAT